MARVLDGVGGQRRQLQVAHVAFNVQRQGFGQRVELAHNFQRGAALGLAAQLQVGHLRCFGVTRGGRSPI